LPGEHANQRRARVYLARHGQTDYNLEGRFQGHLPVPLNDTGRAQAHKLAELAATRGFAVLWCSPLLRARETADIVARRIGLEPREDERLVETDAGEWTDRSFAEVQARSPERFAAFLAADPAFAFPGGESLAAQQVRVAEALAEIEMGPQPSLVVCHGLVIRAALSWHAGRWLTHAERVPNGALVPLDRAPEQDLATGGGELTQPS
jgi:broad specificity phosphatase PhoE